MIWILLHPEATSEMLGLVPDFFSEDDPRPARAQIAERYISGWHPTPGFTMAANGDLLYPPDPPLKALAGTWLRQEIIKFYDHSWLAIIQADDGSIEAGRVD